MTSENKAHAQNAKDDHAKRIIVDRIYSVGTKQRLAPGTRPGEAALADIVGVGRKRVRPSLLSLAGQGIVDLRANRAPM